MYFINISKVDAYNVTSKISCKSYCVFVFKKSTYDLTKPHVFKVSLSKSISN